MDNENYTDRASFRADMENEHEIKDMEVASKSPMIDAFKSEWEGKIKRDEAIRKFVESVESQRDITKDVLKFLKKKQEEVSRSYIEFLEKSIAEHDCHAGPEDGCDCREWKETLRKLKNEPSSIIH